MAEADEAICLVQQLQAAAGKGDASATARLPEALAEVAARLAAVDAALDEAEASCAVTAATLHAARADAAALRAAGVAAAHGGSSSSGGATAGAGVDTASARPRGPPNVAKAGRYYQRQLQDKALSPSSSPQRPARANCMPSARPGDVRGSPSPPTPPLALPPPPPRALGTSGRESRGSCRRLDARSEGAVACCDHIAVAVDALQRQSSSCCGGGGGAGGGAAGGSGGGADKQAFRCKDPHGVMDGPNGLSQLRRRLCHVVDTTVGPAVVPGIARALPVVSGVILVVILLLAF